MAEAGQLQQAGRTSAAPRRSSAWSCCGCGSRKTCPSARSPAAGPPIRRSLHKSYALARKEFRSALLEVVAFHHPGSPVELEEEAASLLKALS